MVKQTNKTNKNIKKSAQRNGQSLYKGVRQRKWGKWVSEIRLPHSRQRIWLGSYDTAEKAAHAFDAALFCLRGYSANFNFPDNLPDIAAGRSLDPSEIQAVAARFANSEPSTSQLSESQTEYSSPSSSEETVQLESDGGFDGSFWDLLTTTDSSNHGSDYGIFEDLDDLYKDILASPLPAVDVGEGNLDGVLVEDSFLWNF